MISKDDNTVNHGSAISKDDYQVRSFILFIANDTSRNFFVE